MIVLWNSFIPH